MGLTEAVRSLRCQAGATSCRLRPLCSHEPLSQGLPSHHRPWPAPRALGWLEAKTHMATVWPSLGQPPTPAPLGRHFQAGDGLC